MIQPTSITNFSRTRAELEEFWIFCILVAGKNSDFAAQKVFALLRRRGNQSPFEYLREREMDLHNMLVANRVGQYARIELAIRQSLNIDLATAALDQLMAIYGVGPKTARFFLLHTRRDCNVAALDTHILRWLREECSVEDAPAATPQSAKEYSRLENLFLSLARAKFPGMAIADIDLMLWAKMSGRL